MTTIRTNEKNVCKVRNKFPSYAIIVTDDTVGEYGYLEYYWLKIKNEEEFDKLKKLIKSIKSEREGRKIKVIFSKNSKMLVHYMMDRYDITWRLK